MNIDLSQTEATELLGLLKVLKKFPDRHNFTLWLSQGEADWLADIINKMSVVMQNNNINVNQIGQAPKPQPSQIRIVPSLIRHPETQPIIMVDVSEVHLITVDQTQSRMQEIKYKYRYGDNNNNIELLYIEYYTIGNIQGHMSLQLPPGIFPMEEFVTDRLIRDSRFATYNFI